MPVRLTDGSLRCPRHKQAFAHGEICPGCFRQDVANVTQDPDKFVKALFDSDPETLMGLRGHIETFLNARVA